MKTASVIATTLVLVANSGCGKVVRGGSGPAGSAAASASAAPVGLPIEAAKVQRAVNPLGAAPYSGPVGSVRGTVTVTGDPAPDLEGWVEQITASCPASARAFYTKLFREGPERRLADALVTVTGYQGFVPASGEVVKIDVRDCTFGGARTFSATFGQRLELTNRDRQAYVPHLVGGPMKAWIVALPGGDAVKLYPDKPGHFGLTDQMHGVMFADVFVVKFPTHAVTGLDGQFEIGRIPVGEVTVDALLPATGRTAERKVSVRDGETTEVNLVIEFKRERDTPKRPAPAPSASGVPPIH